MTAYSPLRYLCVIYRPTAAVIAAWTTVVAYAVYLSVVVVARQEFQGALAFGFLVQLIAASTGYRDRLVRGHFDPLLAGRARRRAVAFAHAVLSMGPGFALWLLLGTLEASMLRRAEAFTPGGLAAIAFASVAVWTVSIPLGRNSGGVIWMIAWLMLAMSHRMHVLSEAYGTRARAPTRRCERRARP